MSHYSDQAASVRVDFFKESGKWYCTEAVKAPPRDSRRYGDLRLDGMLAVCLEPYHEHSHPITMLVSDVEKFAAKAKAHK